MSLSFVRSVINLIWHSPSLERQVKSWTRQVCLLREWFLQPRNSALKCLIHIILFLKRCVFFHRTLMKPSTLAFIAKLCQGCSHNLSQSCFQCFICKREPQWIYVLLPTNARQNRTWLSWNPAPRPSWRLCPRHCNLSQSVVVTSYGALGGKGRWRRKGRLWKGWCQMYPLWRTSSFAFYLTINLS